MWGKFGADDSRPEADLVKIAWGKDRMEALMIKGRLDAEGIEARLSRSPYGGRSPARQIMVRADQADKARSILERVVSEDGRSLL